MPRVWPAQGRVAQRRHRRQPGYQGPAAPVYRKRTARLVHLHVCDEHRRQRQVPIPPFRSVCPLRFAAGGGRRLVISRKLTQPSPITAGRSSRRNPPPQARSSASASPASSACSSARTRERMTGGRAGGRAGGQAHACMHPHTRTHARAHPPRTHPHAPTHSRNPRNPSSQPHTHTPTNPPTHARVHACAGSCFNPAQHVSDESAAKYCNNATFIRQWYRSHGGNGTHEKFTKAVRLLRRAATRRLHGHVAYPAFLCIFACAYVRGRDRSELGCCAGLQRPRRGQGQVAACACVRVTHGLCASHIHRAARTWSQARACLCTTSVRACACVYVCVLVRKLLPTTHARTRVWRLHLALASPLDTPTCAHARTHAHAVNGRCAGLRCTL